MNRKTQVIEALDSCFASVLPDNTEFVIIDNNSNDGTSESIRKYFMQKMHSKYDWQYEYENTNLGVGGGRNRGFHLARGKYLYFLDDDAVISNECYNTFFQTTIRFLESNINIASITTKIKDMAWGCDRIPQISRTEKINGHSVIFRYAGGSHFLRKSAFNDPIYFNIKYGNEEDLPSIIAQEKGYKHVYFDNVYIIHKPLVNKWISGSDTNEVISRCSIAIGYATKTIIYPKIFKPILYLAYIKRCKLHLSSNESRIICDKMVKEVIENNHYNKVSTRTVIRLFREFGLTVF